MSSELKNKLLNFEATPPPQLWQEIAVQLDDCGLEYQFPARLRNAATTPPPSALQNIFSALDIESTPAFATALYEMEVAAPAAAWAGIKKNLDIAQEAAIPEHRRLAPYIKYAAAAAIAGLLFWGGLQLFSGKKADSHMASTVDTVAPAHTITNPSANTAVVTNFPSAEEIQNEDAALEASKHVYAKLDAETIKKKRTVRYDAYDLEIDPSTTVQPRSLDISETAIPNADEQLATTDKYIVLMTPDGNFIRMSKKMGDMVCCVSGEEQDENCTDQMSKWRKQIAEHPKALSPGNFLDIIGLVNSLQED
jgi:hypothetical protein